MQTKIERPVFEVTDDLRKRFNSKVLETSECHIWRGAVNRSGYGAFKFDGRKVDSHVFAWRLANDGKAVPVGKLVKHRCDCRLCVNPEHLELGTPSENRTDSIVRNGQIHGTKLSEDAAIAIRAQYESGVSIESLAECFEVSKRTIRSVIKRESWKHV